MEEINAQESVPKRPPRSTFLKPEAAGLGMAGLEAGLSASLSIHHAHCQQGKKDGNFSTGSRVSMTRTDKDTVISILLHFEHLHKYQII